MQYVNVIEKKKSINLNDIDPNTPIFTYKSDQLIGMVINEGIKGWNLKLGGCLTSIFYYPTRKKCMQAAFNAGYSFYINVELNQ